jgi:hypothetical protein
MKCANRFTFEGRFPAALTQAGLRAVPLFGAHFADEPTAGDRVLVLTEGCCRTSGVSSETDGTKPSKPLESTTGLSAALRPGQRHSRCSSPKSFPYSSVKSFPRRRESRLLSCKIANWGSMVCQKKIKMLFFCKTNRKSFLESTKHALKVQNEPENSLQSREILIF